jgi:hypothetical protein
MKDIFIGDLMLNRIYFIAFVLLTLLFIVGFYLHYKFIKTLKSKHNEIWKNLMSPSYAFNSFESTISVIKFLRKKQYLIVNDPSLTRVSKKYWIFGCIYLLYFVILFCFFLIVNFME